MLFQVASVVLLLATPLLATNTAGDPTDITNWPPCAQKCIPGGYGPPANCGNLSNLTCVCTRGQFSAQIYTCEQLDCSDQESKDIATLSQRLCAPVGGFGSSLSATITAVGTTTQSSVSVTPTIPPGVTAASAVSSVLATATLAPYLGNPANILSYPRCAQICNNETQVLEQRLSLPGTGAVDLSNTKVACGASFRGLTAGCEAASCSSDAYAETQLLAQQLCGSFYKSNATLGSAVSSAVASATAAAKAATVGKDPVNLANWPACAQNCIPQNNYYGCGSFSNLECICQGVAFNDGIGPCETSTCSTEDMTTIIFLAEKLCEPVGGILTHPVNYTNASNTTTSPSPSPSPFTGEGNLLRTGEVALIGSGIAFAIGLLML